MNQIETVLTGAGVNLTAMRILIFTEICRIGGAFSLNDIEQGLETVDKSTIFRTLTLFLEKGLLHEIDDGSACRKYCRSSHVHFTCIRCHRTLCLDEVKIPTLVIPVGVKVVEVNCVVKGGCPDCGTGHGRN